MCTIYDESVAVPLHEEVSRKWRKKNGKEELEGYDLVIVWAPLFALQHSCILLSLVARRHARAFKIPRNRAVYSIYRIYVYSVIDPSGT